MAIGASSEMMVDQMQENCSCSTDSSVSFLGSLVALLGLTIIVLVIVLLQQNEKVNVWACLKRCKRFRRLRISPLKTRNEAKPCKVTEERMAKLKKHNQSVSMIQATQVVQATLLASKKFKAIKSFKGHDAGMAIEDHLSKLRPYEIDYKELKFLSVIGAGNFGCVYRGEWLGTEVAIKKPHRNIDPRDKENFLAEVDLLAKIHHPNIVIFMAASLREPGICLVLEYLPRGNLQEFLRNKANESSITLQLVLRFAVDISRGMKYLHHRLGVIQRDLKPCNLLIDESNNVKICDFGLSRYLSNQRSSLTFCGTPYWTAPEVILQNNYNSKADIFSFSIVLWQLITREEPYEGRGEMETAMAVATEHLRPKIPRYCPEEIQQLILEGWSPDPSDRPDFEAILERLQAIKKQYHNQHRFKKAIEAPLKSICPQNLIESSDRN